MNSLLRSWTRGCVWILAGVILAAFASPSLAIVLATATGAAVMGAVLLAARKWRSRPSTYQAAYSLDSAAGLQDRVSTALYFGELKNPDEMVLRQRRDALAHFTRVQPRALFPIQAPAWMGRALVLAAIAASLLLYRVSHPAPMVSLWQAAAQSQFVQSVVSPLIQALQKDLEKVAAFSEQVLDVANQDKALADSEQVYDEMWQAPGQDEGGADAGQPDFGQGEGQGDQPSLEQPLRQDSDNQNADPQDQQGAQVPVDGGQQGKPGSNESDQQGKSPSSNSQAGRQSLSKSLMQALKSLMSNPPKQQSAEGQNPSNTSPSGEGMPQPGNTGQPGGSDRSQKDSQAMSDSQQKAKDAGSGAGSQPGDKQQPNQEQAQRPVTAVPDRVALETIANQEKTRMRIATETGTAKVPLRDTSPRAVAVVKGAEQENIPPRYRQYVQRYFEHAETSSQ